MKIEGPYRSRKDLQAGLKAYIAILKVAVIIGIILAGAHVVNKLDKIMADQAQLIKTQADAMDQIMWIRMDILTLEEQIYMLEDRVDNLKTVDSSAYNLSVNERDLVERIVMAEAGNQPIEGMAAVAQVVRDRSVSWGQSIKDVCLAPGQFAKPYPREVSAEAVQAVSAVFDEGMSVLEIPTTHFHSDYVSPYWTADKVSRGQIGCHRFYGE